MITTMDVEFRDQSLDRLETGGHDAGYHPDIVKAFRKRLQQIRAASDVHEFCNLRSLRFEKLKGKRAGQYSMRLNDQWRLVMEIRGRGRSRIAEIVAIEDYH